MEGGNKAGVARRTDLLFPLRRSSQMQSCALYWVPVSSFPCPVQERQWLMALFNGLHKFLLEKCKLRQESFLQMKLAAPLGPVKDLLHRNQMELMPVVGLSLRPGAGLPPIPTVEDLEPVIQGRQKFNFNDYVGDYCMWFLNRKERWRRELFLGYGGYTMIYLAPDPKTAPPAIPDLPGLRSMPMFSQYDVETMWEITFLLSDEFGPRSKAIFGKGFEDDPNFAGTTYIIPLMSAQDFLNGGRQKLDDWFRLFDVFIQESAGDDGILIASKHDLDDELGKILARLRESNIHHPFYAGEGARVLRVRESK